MLIAPQIGSASGRRREQQWSAIEQQFSAINLIRGADREQLKFLIIAVQLLDIAVQNKNTHPCMDAESVKSVKSVGIMWDGGGFERFERFSLRRAAKPKLA